MRAIPLLRRLASVLLLLAAALPARAAVDVQRVVSPSGIEAWLVEDHAIPVVSLDFAFRDTGAAVDPEGKAGLARLVAATLDEGAGELDSQAFQRRLEDLAASLGFETGRDAFRGRLTTLSEKSGEAFALLRMALAEPRFDADAVERMRQALLLQVARESEDPDSVAWKAWFAEAFPDHPYGRPVQGTADTLPAIAIDDLRAYLRDYLTRDRLVVGVAGDITPEELGPALDRIFGGLPQSGAAAEIPRVEPKLAGGVQVVPMAVPQSAIVFGQKGLSRDDPDFYAAFVLTHILGGGSFSSRLYQEVREARGLAYGVYAFLNPLDRAALLMGSSATQNARAAETVAVLRDEWERIAREGIGAEELAAAKSYITGSYPLRFGSTGSIAANLVGIQLDRLGIDYIATRNDLIRAVDLESVNRLAQDLIRPGALSFVVVGAPEGLGAKAGGT